MVKNAIPHMISAIMFSSFFCFFLGFAAGCFFGVWLLSLYHPAAF